jgi:hypothetical protein
MDTTKALAENIKSNLLLIKAIIQWLAYSKYIQEGDCLSDSAQRILENRYHRSMKLLP